MVTVGFHPATRSVHSTPADNTRRRVWPRDWQYIEKERLKDLKQETSLIVGILVFYEQLDFHVQLSMK